MRTPLTSLLISTVLISSIQCTDSNVAKEALQLNTAVVCTIANEVFNAAIAIGLSPPAFVCAPVNLTSSSSSMTSTSTSLASIMTTSTTTSASKTTTLAPSVNSTTFTQNSTTFTSITQSSSVMNSTSTSISNSTSTTTATTPTATPFVQTNCPAGSGYASNSSTSCTSCSINTYSIGNTTSCLSCAPFNSTTQTYPGCYADSGLPYYCNDGYGILQGFCTACLYGLYSRNFANLCTCNAGTTLTPVCLNGTAPLTFTSALISVTFDYNGCKQDMGFLTRTSPGRFDGEIFGYSFDKTLSLVVNAPTSSIPSTSAIALQATIPFIGDTSAQYSAQYSGAVYQYLGFELYFGGDIARTLSSLNLSSTIGTATGATFTNPNTYFQEIAIANGNAEFGAGGLKAESDVWIVNAYKTCSNGYPLTLSLRVPITVGLGAFVSTNASFTDFGGTLHMYPVDFASSFILPGVYASTAGPQIFLTLVPQI